MKMADCRRLLFLCVRFLRCAVGITETGSPSAAEGMLGVVGWSLPNILRLSADIVDPGRCLMVMTADLHFEGAVGCFVELSRGYLRLRLNIPEVPSALK